MSVIKTKSLKKLGFTKNEIKKIRRYVISFLKTNPKSNKKYAINNIICHLNKLDSFWIYATKIDSIYLI